MHIRRVIKIQMGSISVAMPVGGLTAKVQHCKRNEEGVKKAYKCGKKGGAKDERPRKSSDLHLIARLC